MRCPALSVLLCLGLLGGGCQRLFPFEPARSESGVRDAAHADQAAGLDHLAEQQVSEREHPRDLWPSAGDIVCGTGLTACAGVCVDVSTDLQHCGGCGNACAAGSCQIAQCSGGHCVTAQVDNVPCDDGDPCTMYDVCKSGTCSGQDKCLPDTICRSWTCNASTSYQCSPTFALDGISCASQQSCCGGTCCDIGKCCVGKCCPSGNCCSFGCCPPDYKCCSEGCCPPGTNCCGANGCCPADRSCCNDICCQAGETCCGGKICCPPGQTCCGSVCC